VCYSDLSTLIININKSKPTTTTNI
jgi:hypothetical protein